MNKRHFAAVAASLAFAQFSLAQGSSSPNTNVEKRVDAILGKMTVEEKITLIGGVNDFSTRPIPRLGIPSFSDVG
jgi:beta-glucosidase